MKVHSGKAGFYGWRLIAALCLILIATVSFPMYGGAVLNSAMARDLGLDAALAGLPISVFMLTVGLMAPLVALALSRVSARAVIAFGAAAIATGACAMSFMVQTPLTASLLYGGLIGCGVAFGGILATQTLATRWFMQRRTRAMAVLAAVVSIGAFVAPSLLDIFVRTSTSGWRDGWLLVAGMALIAAIIALAAVREQPSDLGQEVDGGTPAPDEKTAGFSAINVNIAPRDALRTPAYWIIMLGTNVFSGSFSLILAHGIPHMVERGETSTTGALTISIVMAAGLASKLVAGAIGDRFDPRLIWAAGLSATTAGLAIAAFARGPLLAYAYPATVGLGLGVSSICMMALIANYYGKPHFAALSSGLIAGQTLTGFMVPILSGWVFNAIGDYRPAFLVMAGFSALVSILLFMMRAPVARTSPD